MDRADFGLVELGRAVCSTSIGVQAIAIVGFKKTTILKIAMVRHGQGRVKAAEGEAGWGSLDGPTLSCRRAGIMKFTEVGSTRSIRAQPTSVGTIVHRASHNLIAEAIFCNCTKPPEKSILEGIISTFIARLISEMPFA